MTERWQREVAKLHRAELPGDLWERITEGPRLQPPSPRRPSRVIVAATALVVFIAAAALLWIVFTPFRTTVRTLAGSDVLPVPARGESAPVFLGDGRPVFVVHHEDGTVSVVDAFSPHRAWGFEEPVEWCSTTRQFVEWAHEAHFNEYGAWVSAGPAPSGLATFAFQVVERDAAGDPASIRVGAMQAPDPGGSAPITDPGRPPFCPGAEPVTFTVDASQVWDSPGAAVAAQPEGWIAVRGTLSVASDGFVQLCSTLEGERCQDAAVVRGIDGVGLMVNVLQPFPGSGYEKPHVWLAQVRAGVLDDLAIGDIRTSG
jgi:hypothetical protein